MCKGLRWCQFTYSSNFTHKSTYICVYVCMYAWIYTYSLDLRPHCGICNPLSDQLQCKFIWFLIWHSRVCRQCGSLRLMILISEVWILYTHTCYCLLPEYTFTYIHTYLCMLWTYIIYIYLVHKGNKLTIVFCNAIHTDLFIWLFLFLVYHILFDYFL